MKIEVLVASCNVVKCSAYLKTTCITRIVQKKCMSAAWRSETFFKSIKICSYCSCKNKLKYDHIGVGKNELKHFHFGVVKMN